MTPASATPIKAIRLIPSRRPYRPRASAYERKKDNRARGDGTACRARLDAGPMSKPDAKAWVRFKLYRAAKGLGRAERRCR